MFIISHSYQTVRSYKTVINRLRSFLQEKHQIDEVDLLDHVSKNKIDIYNLIKEFVVYLDQSGLSPRTIKLSVTVVKSYLRHFGIKIDSDDLKMVVKVPWTTCTSRPRRRAASSRLSRWRYRVTVSS